MGFHAPTPFTSPPVPRILPKNQYGQTTMTKAPKTRAEPQLKKPVKLEAKLSAPTAIKAEPEPAAAPSAAPKFAGAPTIIPPAITIPVPAIAEDLWPTDDAADQATLHAAEEVFNHLMGRVKEFQANLPAHHELGIQLANFGGERALHVRGMGFRNPNIIEFYGLLDGDQKVTVVQHVSQLNFLLIAVPPVPEQAPYRIGFGAALRPDRA